jgi:hypothetical protein
LPVAGGFFAQRPVAQLRIVVEKGRVVGVPDMVMFPMEGEKNLVYIEPDS